MMNWWWIVYDSGLDVCGIKCLDSLCSQSKPGTTSLLFLPSATLRKNPTFWILGQPGKSCSCWGCTRLATDHADPYWDVWHCVATWGLLRLMHHHTPVETKWWLLPEHYCGFSAAEPRDVRFPSTLAVPTETNGQYWNQMQCRTGGLSAHSSSYSPCISSVDEWPTPTLCLEPWWLWRTCLHQDRKLRETCRWQPANKINNLAFEWLNRLQLRDDVPVPGTMNYQRMWTWNWPLQPVHYHKKCRTKYFLSALVMISGTR